MKTLLDLSVARRNKAKRDGGTIKKGFELYQDFVDQNYKLFEDFVRPQYRCSGCNKMTPESDCTMKKWAKTDDITVGVCSACIDRMKKGSVKYVEKLEG